MIICCESYETSYCCSCHYYHRFSFSFSRSTQKVEKNVHLVHQKNETMSTLIKCLVLNIDNDQSMTKAQRNVNYFYFFFSIPSNHSSLGFIFIDLIASVAKFVVKFNVRLYQIISISYRKLPFYVWKVEAKKKEENSKPVNLWPSIGQSNDWENVATVSWECRNCNCMW